MKNKELKQIAALLNALFSLSSFREERHNPFQLEIIRDLCYRYASSLSIRDITRADPLAEFLRIEDRQKREYFLNILLRFDKAGDVGAVNPKKAFYLAHLLVALDR